MSATKPAPSAFQLQRVMALAMETLERLRSDDGLVLETEAELRGALAEEGIEVEDILRRLVRFNLDAKANGIAADSRLADLRIRRERFRRQEETSRATILAALDAVGLTKFHDPEFSLSVAPGRPTASVPDETDVPPAFYRITQTLDMALVRDMAKAGKAPRWVVMSNGAPILTIRTK